MRFISVLVILALAGCVDADGTAASSGEAYTGLIPNNCGITLPNGENATCKQKASTPRLGIRLGPQVGMLCVGETLAGQNGQIQVWRNLVTGETGIQLDVPASNQFGIVWQEGNPQPIWAWDSAEGTEFFVLAPMEVGTAIVVETFSLQFMQNSSSAGKVWVNWDIFDNQPFGVYELRHDLQTYFATATIAVKTGTDTDYVLVSSNFLLGGDPFAVQHQRGLSAKISIGATPQACSIT
jgi:hypothetical protein